jgi:pilus assembly protein CpaB
VQRAKGDAGDEAAVLVSSKTIDVATRINEGMVGSTRVSPKLVPRGAFTEKDRKALVGRVTAMTIAPGVPITASMLAPPGSEPGLRAIIPQGHRAVSVSVTEDSAVAGFIMPGSRVDVSAMGRDGVSKVILTDVEVGAVGQSLSEVGSDGKTVRVAKSVTLFVRPEQVGVLHAYTASGGRIRLAMRGDRKDATESLWARLLEKAMQAKSEALPAKVPARVAMARNHVVDVVRGQEVQRYEFDSSGALQGTRTGSHGYAEKSE